MKALQKEKLKVAGNYIKVHLHDPLMQQCGFVDSKKLVLDTAVIQHHAMQVHLYCE